MITAEEVRKKAHELIETQTEMQLKREEEQLNKIQEEIIKIIERDATATAILTTNLYKNNLDKLEELGFSCEKKDSYLDCINYQISW